jgi:biotin carboxylase
MADKTPEKKHIFVVGLDDVHAEDVRAVRNVERFEIHPLLRTEEVIDLEEYDVDATLEKAEKILDDFDGPIDAIVGHWDFPVTSLVPILCKRRGLRAPSLEAVLKCAHKYWSRLEQRKHIPECTPEFCAIDPFAEDPYSQVTLDFPFWIKPVMGYSSTLGFRVNNRKDFDRAIEEARKKIRRFGDPFNTILKRAELPDELGEVDGNYMLAEQIIKGVEIAPEGYVQDGKFHAHGVVDMVRGPNRKSFSRYGYPSGAPKKLKARVLDAAERIMLGIGFDNGCFNMEFFHDPTTDKLWMIEINPRISQSHSQIFRMVDGMSNHQVALHVALGEDPHFEKDAGPFKVAAKFLLRRYDTRDGVCTRVPTAEELAGLKEDQPRTQVSLLIREGQRLSKLLDQDPYSYVLATLIVGADSGQELLWKYREAAARLRFEFELDEVPRPAAKRRRKRVTH